MNVFDLSARILLDSNEYTKGLNSASDETKSFGSKLTSALGTAGKVAVGVMTTVASAVVALSKEFAEGIKATAEYGDNIDKMSQKMGLSAEAYQEWDFIMQHAGTNIESMKASMKTLANAVDSNNDAFGRLGITQEQLASMSQEELFGEVIKGLQNVEDTTERTYLAGQLLGRGATELGALLNMSAEDTEAMKQQVHDLGAVMSDEAVKASAQYADSLQNLQWAIQGLSRGTFAEFLPAVVNMMDGLTAIFSGDSESGIGLITKGVDEFTAQLSETIPKVMDIGSQILLGLIQSISTNLPKMMDSAVDTVMTFIQGLVGMLPSIIDAGIKIIVSLIKGIGQSLPTLIPAIVKAVLTIVKTIVGNIDLLIDGVLTFMLGFVDGIIQSIPVIIDALPELINSLIDGLLGAIPQIIEAGITLLTSLIGALPEIIAGIVEHLPEIINGIIKGIMDNLPAIIMAGVQLFISLIENIPEIIKGIVTHLPEIIVGIVQGIGSLAWQLIQAGVDLMVKLGEGISSWASKIWDKIKEIGQGIIDKIKGFFSNMKDAGLNLVKGLWQGINDAVSWVLDKIKGFGQKILDGIKSIFGIKSPSREMAWIGRMLDEGLAKGIEDFSKDVVRSATAMMDGVSDVFANPVSMDIDANYNLKSNKESADGTKWGNQRIDTININVYGTEGQSAEEIADYTIEKLQRTLIGDTKVYGYI